MYLAGPLTTLYGPFLLGQRFQETSKFTLHADSYTTETHFRARGRKPPLWAHHWSIQSVSTGIIATRSYSVRSSSVLSVCSRQNNSIFTNRRDLWPILSAWT